MEGQKSDYQDLYSKFMDEYSKNPVGGAEVGEIIAKMAHFFAKYNLLTAAYERELNKKSAEIESGIDDKTGKPISSTKAKVMTSATDEYNNHLINRTHLQNIEQYINALKSLQKGLLNEYSHMS